MAKLNKTYMVVVAPNELIVPVPPGEVGGSVELSDAEIEAIFGDTRGDWHVVVAPSKEVPTLATLAQITSCAGYTAHTQGECLVTVTKHIRRGETLWAGVIPVERPSSKPRPKEVTGLKEDFIRHVGTNPRGLKIFNLDGVLKKIKALQAADELAFWLLALTPLPHELRMRLAPRSTADQVEGLRAWLNSADRKADVKQVRSLTAEDHLFLQAIIETPEDDTPRLVYADWLEERGDPRGEFIRIQCRSAKIKTFNRRKAELQKQEQTLLHEYEKEWLGPLLKLRRTFLFQRGFPVPFEGISAKEFLKEGQQMLNLCPVQSLTLMNHFDHESKIEQLKAIAASPFLGRLKRLCFTIEGMVNRRGHYHATGLGIGDEGAKILASSPHVGRLTRLDLRENEIGDAGARALAASRNLASLVQLDLSANPVGLQGARALAASKTLVNLKSLNMMGTEIGAEGTKILRARFKVIK